MALNDRCCRPSANGQLPDREAGRAERDDGTAFQIVGHSQQVLHEQRGVRLRCELGYSTKVDDGRIDRAAQCGQARSVLSDDRASQNQRRGGRTG